VATALLLTWVLPGWGGCSTSPPEAATAGDERRLATADTDSGAGDDESASPAKVVEARSDGLLPVLTDEALAARVEAQRRYLGNRAIFEDQQGRPVPAIAADDDPETQIEDDILDALPGSSGIGDAAVDNSKRANGNALGLYVPIEHPAGGKSSLDHFHQALARLEKQKTGKVRIAVYGASHTQADIYQGYMRTYLQSRFGDGGHGYVAMVKTNKWYRQSDFSVDSSKGWRVDHAQKREGRKDGLYGLMGANASSSSKRDHARVYPRDRSNPASEASHFEIQFLMQPGGGDFYVYADKKKIATVETKSDATSAGRHSFELPLAHHDIEVRPKGNGEVRIFGLIAEKNAPGVVVDTLGIAGTRAANMLKWDEPVWADYLTARPPDLWTLAYGTNETTDVDQPIEDYVHRLRQVIMRFRNAAPEASCVLIGPGDFPRKSEDESWVPRPRLAQIIEAQRNVAYEMGCGFWDGLAFMGGTGSMHTWSTASPSMGSKDHIHLTRRGYVRMGMGVTDATMAGYDARSEVASQ
jgi:lysophospholipase L1-like esterase